MQQKIFHQQPPSFALPLVIGWGNVRLLWALLVRFADSGPSPQDFWATGTGHAVSVAGGLSLGFRLCPCAARRWPLSILAGLLFGVDIICGISAFSRQIGQPDCVANCASLLLVIYGVRVARKMPSKWESLGALRLCWRGAVDGAKP